jgi:hypothetical protein
MAVIDVSRLEAYGQRARSWMGVAAMDLPRFLLLMIRGGPGYLAFCNRNERLDAGPQGVGYACRWKWTSDLHAAKVVPRLGKRIMSLALTDHPIGRATETPAIAGQSPEISFLIGHRGTARIPQLLATLESIAAQNGPAIECVVIEQDIESGLRGRLPAWVKHVHLPPPAADMAYCRSWAFNVGARHARGRILVLHDNDLLVPQDYAACLLSHFREGYEMVNLKRFVFYLAAGHTAEVLEGRAKLVDMAPEAIMQNAECGGSIAVLRDAYERIGGMDESFVGWGGEDNEFCERAQTLRIWPYAYLPFVHLWHPAQPGKQRLDNPTLRRFNELSAIPAEERVARLRQLQAGNMAGPVGWSRPAHPGLERTT